MVIASEIWQKYLQAANTLECDSNSTDQREESPDYNDTKPHQVASVSVDNLFSTDEDVFEEKDRAKCTVSLAPTKFYAAYASGLIDVVSIGVVAALPTGFVNL